MNSAALDRDDVATMRRALNGCADDLMSTPYDGLAPEYVQAVEDISRLGGVQWPETDIIGQDLLSFASELEPGSSLLPDALKPVLRPLAAAALHRHAVEVEQESGGELKAGSDADVEIDRAVRLASLVLGPAVRVTARRWSGGWELYALGIEDLVTRVGSLEDAPRLMRDLLETEFPGADFSKVQFDIHVDR